MKKKKNRLSLEMTAVVILSVLLVVAAGVIGFFLSSQSSDAMRTLINERMLDISNTAAAMMDGDALTGMTAEDIGTPEFRKSMDTLRTFYDNIELEFIYCIYDRGNGQYVFGIDPSDDPGTFGDPIITTPALVNAFRGISSVDQQAYEDDWGVFYSAYSPVFNSAGEVACVVAVDFDANWYNDRLTRQLWTVLAVVFLTLAAGIGITVLIAGQMRKHARRDLMTGTGNRNAYREKVDQLNRHIADGSAAFAIGIFDINNLKQINDSCGHETGDGIIVQAAGALTEVFGTENIFRIGGDEFIAILDKADEKDTSRLGAQLQEIILRLNRTPVHPEAELAVSRGFAVFDPQKDSNFLSIFRRADQDMYSNKESFYRSEDVRRKLTDVSSSAARSRARVQYIADRLETAIAKGHIRAWIQPIVRLANNQVCAEEALARWNDPEQGMISPAEFIPALEEARLAYKLDLHMVEEVAAFLRKKNEEGIPLVPVSVNLSRTDFDACDMVEEIAKRMDHAGVDRGLLRVEITESVVGSDFDFMRRQIERFGEKGFKVWMDDFGSGFSSLDVLQNLHFDTIKLDMRFMREFAGSDRSRIILTELISMAMGLGINTIVEGVEKEEQVRFLREIGAGKVQGFFFSPPISQDSLRERHSAGAVRIGLENPGETEYYNIISKINLQDPSMITQDNAQEDYSSYFRTLPIAVLEAGEQDAMIVRANRSYREFLNRYMDYHMEEGQQVSVPLNDPALRNPFVEALTRLRDNGNWETIRETLANGKTVHAFVRRIAENPVTGKSAIALIVLAVF